MLLLIAFAMLSQRRILSLINLFAWQGLVLSLSTFVVAYSTDQHHLYYSAGLTLLLKVLVVAVAAASPDPQAERASGMWRR